jgi:SAM-dependent methyltransferase
VGDFAEGESVWIERQGNLRNVIRHEMIARQLAGYARPGMTVLDVGCGQGTQALALARAGCEVTGVDPSHALLDWCATDARDEGLPLELLEGRIDDLQSLLDERDFDLVCAHGLLMYLDDRTTALTMLAARVAPGGLLSITIRNGHALALRPGLRGDWPEALRSYDSLDYVNELGVHARADLLDHVEQALENLGLSLVRWYGVRVLNDAAPVDAPCPPAADLALLLDAEDQAGRRDPYRWMASQLHLIARQT